MTGNALCCANLLEANRGGCLISFDLSLSLQIWTVIRMNGWPPSLVSPTHSLICWSFFVWEKRIVEWLENLQARWFDTRVAQPKPLTTNPPRCREWVYFYIGLGKVRQRGWRRGEGQKKKKRLTPKKERSLMPHSPLPLPFFLFVYIQMLRDYNYLSSCSDLKDRVQLQRQTSYNDISFSTL